MDHWKRCRNLHRHKFGSHIRDRHYGPEIEIFSVDLLESVYPDMVLGNPKETAAHVPEPAGTGKKKRKKTKASGD